MLSMIARAGAARLRVLPHIHGPILVLPVGVGEKKYLYAMNVKA